MAEQASDITDMTLPVSPEIRVADNHGGQSKLVIR